MSDNKGGRYLRYLVAILLIPLIAFSTVWLLVGFFSALEKGTIADVILAICSWVIPAGLFWIAWKLTHDARIPKTESARIPMTAAARAAIRQFLWAVLLVFAAIAVIVVVF